MATSVPDRKFYNKFNKYNILVDRTERMDALCGGRTRRDCPIFRTKSDKLDMANGSWMVESGPESARLLAFGILQGVADLMLGEQFV